MSDDTEDHKDFRMKIHDVDRQELGVVQRAEAKFLKVSEKKLLTMIPRSTPIKDLTEIEAMVDLEYLTLICLHLRRDYYRRPLFSEVSDATYDLVEARAKAIMRSFPYLVSSNHPLHQVGY